MQGAANLLLKLHKKSIDQIASIKIDLQKITAKWSIESMRLLSKPNVTSSIESSSSPVFLLATSHSNTFSSFNKSPENCHCWYSSLIVCIDLEPVTLIVILDLFNELLSMFFGCSK